ncbi:MAG: hypothetical protein KAG61_08710 [Bacteriovoracaceae bacterium]|nr:hypothetical protein [Bacteriovoracaceae bacterium]
MLRPDLTSFETCAQNEALINEFKGNLFEYLVAVQMARHYGVESSFVKSFSGKVREQFSYYESWLRKHDLELVKKLPKLAQCTFSGLVGELPKKIDQVFVVGKMASGSGNKELDEADVAYVVGDKLFPVSVKLCKANAYVNTKSGGIKTFLSKYFSAFPSVNLLQENLSKTVEASFNRVGHNMYDSVGLDWRDRFDHQWTDQLLSELPGQLPKDLNMILQVFYHDTIEALYHDLESLFSEDKKLFKRCLLPLVGLGRSDMVQVTCFHRDSKVNNEVSKYNFDSVDLYTSKRFDNVDVQLGELKSGISSFEIFLGKTTLQIRVKPMNKFTAPALKVNCSVKVKGRDS